MKRADHSLSGPARLSSPTPTRQPSAGVLAVSALLARWLTLCAVVGAGGLGCMPALPPQTVRTASPSLSPPPSPEPSSFSLHSGAAPVRTRRRIVCKDGTVLTGWVDSITPGEPVAVAVGEGSPTLVPWHDILRVDAASTPPETAATVAVAQGPELDPALHSDGADSPLHVGVVLRDGTLLAGTATSYLPGESVTLTTALGRPRMVPWRQIARITRFPDQLPPAVPAPASAKLSRDAKAQIAVAVIVPTVVLAGLGVAVYFGIVAAPTFLGGNH